MGSSTSSPVKYEHCTSKPHSFSSASAYLQRWLTTLNARRMAAPLSRKRPLPRQTIRLHSLSLLIGELAMTIVSDHGSPFFPAVSGSVSPSSRDQMDTAVQALHSHKDEWVTR